MKSRTAVVALVTMLALLTSVMAQSRKVLVLPLDGNAPEAQRTRLNESVAKLSKDKLGGDVTVGDTTFSETAAAVGCDPAEPACAETVRTTLQVDDLVYGSATTEAGSTTVIVMRASAGSEPKSQISVIGETDTGEQAEGNLGPLFTTDDGSGSQALGSGPADSGSGSGSAAAPPQPHSNFFDTRERKLAVAFSAGGVIALVVGLSLWSSAGGLQDQIDGAPNETVADIKDLEDLEDRAGSKALWGNVFFFAGLAAAGVGGYFFWKDHSNRNATIAPVPTEDGTGMTLVLGGRW
jgi:hypothetical protein